MTVSSRFGHRMCGAFGVSAFLFILQPTLCIAQVLLPLPPRQPGAPTGSQFVTQITSLSLTDREAAIKAQFAAGNVPDFLRTLKPVTVNMTISGTPHSVTYYVTPDYISIGTEADYFRTPMTPTLGQQLADIVDGSLPTRKMVNDIWTASALRLAPITIPPSAAMITVPVMNDHNTSLTNQRTPTLGAHPHGTLIGGTKKDVVITNELGNRPPPARVAIYGWHYTDGTFIQPLSLVHESTYADYSHGVRLVRNAVTLDGAPSTVQAVLANSATAALLSDEGVMTTWARYPVPVQLSLPYIDAFPSTGRQLTSWIDRFKTPTIGALSPTAPGGDGFVLTVKDTTGGIDTTRIGNATDADYFVEAQIYCQYRPALAADGFERVGIFARDNGNGLFTGISGGGVQGNCYAMTWDGNDGRLRCNRVVAGVPTDLLPSTVTLPSTAWRQFRIEVQGTSLRFLLDGGIVFATTDATFAQGVCGIGYQEVFTTNANILGTRADNFRAGALPQPSSSIRVF